MVRGFSKYYNQKVEVQIAHDKTITFHSKGESERYMFLCAEQKKGVITGLKTQVILPLYNPFDKRLVARYVADFVYNVGNTQIVEDFKSVATLTVVFRLKKALFEAYYSQPIHVVLNPTAPVPLENA